MVHRPLSAHAQLLWFHLLYRTNEAFWQSPLYLRTAELHGAMGVSLSAFKKARQELVERGYLLYEPAAGNKAAGYSLMSCANPGQIIKKNNFPEADATVAPGGPEEY